MIRNTIYALILSVVLLGCEKQDRAADLKYVEYFDGISIAQISGNWYLAKGSDRRVPISETFDEIPDKILITAENYDGVNDIMFWSIDAGGLFGSGSMGLGVDVEGDILGYNGIYAGGVFVTLLFRHHEGVLTMMMFTLVTNQGQDARRVHVATYYK